MNHTKIRTKPTSLDDFVFGSKDAERKLREILENPSVIGNARNGILLHGAFGTGKTELARLLPEMIDKAIAGEAGDWLHVNTMEIICCSTGGVEQVATAKAFAACAAVESQYRYVILDEIDNLSSVAQANLKGIMSASPHACWIATTNHIGDIDAGIRSRLTSIAMPEATAEAWLPRVRQILSSRSQKYDDASLLEILNQLPSKSARDVMEVSYRLMN